MKETPEVLEMGAHSDPHSPARWRVNGPVADVPAFGQAFQCKAGTPMSPGDANDKSDRSKVCSVW
jgi:predicted metalloendopeptidase